MALFLLQQKENIMDEKKDKYEYKGTGLNRSEKKHGQEKFDEYCQIYHIVAYSDLQLLEELIYRELLQERIKEDIARKEEKNKSENKEAYVPKFMTETMNQNLEQILMLKEKLGLLSREETNDGFNYIQQLREKFKIWCEENQASRTLVCPHCSKMILLKIKTDIWESQQHPIFKDKILYNEHLVNLYLSKKITAEDVSKILGTSEKYTEWLIKKFHQRKEKENE